MIPFSSFYGLLDLLSGTELNPGQSEIGELTCLSGDIFQFFATSTDCQAIVRTVAQGPVSLVHAHLAIGLILLQIIDSILDYSKLEASGMLSNQGRT